MRFENKISSILMCASACMLSACVASSDSNVVEAVLDVSAPSHAVNSYAPKSKSSVFPTTSQSLLSEEPKSRTYLINGLASHLPAVGYGFTNLAKKTKNTQLFNYASFVEGSVFIQPRIIKDIKAEFRRDPNTQFNLVGISYGANIASVIAAHLARAGIPVNYLATMDAPTTVPIHDNVVKVDNFTCSKACFGTTSRLGPENTKTKFKSFLYPTTHISLANYEAVHKRILAQLALN